MAEWRDVVGYEGYYRVSSDGEIESLYKRNGTKCILQPHLIKGWIEKPSKNYLRRKVRLTKPGTTENISVHRIVAEAFIPKEPGLDVVNHKDFNPLNNKVENLEWCTSHYNHYYSTKAFRRVKNLTLEKYELSKKDYLDGKPVKQICKENDYGYSGYLSKMKEEGIQIRDSSFYRDKYHINLKELLKELKQGKTNKELSEKYGCPSNLIARRKYQFKKKGLLT